MKGISAIKSPNVPVISAKPENAMIVVIVAEKTGGAILMAAFSAATMGFSPKLRALKSAGSIIPAVIEGGKSKIGLESTIIDVSGSVPILLRPGGLIIEDIQTVLGTITLKNQKKVLNSPGQLESHYAPETKMRLNASNKRSNEVLLGFGVSRADLNLSEKGDLTEAASNLFSQMRLIDNLAKKIGADCIAVSPIPQIGLGLALNDRLQRAAFRN